MSQAGSSGVEQEPVSHEIPEPSNDDQHELDSAQEVEKAEPINQVVEEPIEPPASTHYTVADNLRCLYCRSTDYSDGLIAHIMTTHPEKTKTYLGRGYKENTMVRRSTRLGAKLRSKEPTGYGLLWLDVVDAKATKNLYRCGECPKWSTAGKMYCHYMKEHGHNNPFLLKCEWCNREQAVMLQHDHHKMKRYVLSTGCHVLKTHRIHFRKWLHRNPLWTSFNKEDNNKKHNHPQSDTNQVLTECFNCGQQLVAETYKQLKFMVGYHIRRTHSHQMFKQWKADIRGKPLPFVRPYGAPVVMEDVIRADQGQSSAPGNKLVPVQRRGDLVKLNMDVRENVE